MTYLPEFSPNVLALCNAFALACNQVPTPIDLCYGNYSEIFADKNHNTSISKGKKNKYPRAWATLPINSTIVDFNGQYVEKFNVQMVFAVSVIDTVTKKKTKTYSTVEGIAAASATAKNFIVSFKSILAQQGWRGLDLDTKNIQFVTQRMNQDETAYQCEIRLSITAKYENPCLPLPTAIVAPFDTLTNPERAIIDKDILKYE